MTTLFALCAIFATISLSPGSAEAQTTERAASGPPAAGAAAELVPVEPGETEATGEHAALAAYLRETEFYGDLSNVTIYLTGPMAAAPEGTRFSAVYAIEYGDLASCGSIGCTEVVVTRDREGNFLLYDEVVGTELTLLPSAHRGFRDLSSKTGNGVLVGVFNGTRYVWSPKAAETTDAQQAEAALPQGPQLVRGECRDGMAWLGIYRENGDSAAYYGRCDNEENYHLLAFECRPNGNKIAVEVAVDANQVIDGDPLQVVASVGGRSFSLAGTADYDLMNGVVVPQLAPLPMESPLLDALSRAAGAEFSAPGGRMIAHLSGSAEAIELMRGGCAGAPSQEAAGGSAVEAGR